MSRQATSWPSRASRMAVARPMLRGRAAPVTSARDITGTYVTVRPYALGVYRFDAEVWLHDGDAAWHFITVPCDISDDIEARTEEHRRGFGSARVRVTIGATTWSTSVFPDAKR